MDRPGMVVNSACGQLNRENIFFPVPVRAREFGLARRVRPSRPASARSFCILGLNHQSGAYLRDFSPFPRGNINFPCSVGHVQGWQPYAVDPYSCYMCGHTYIHVSKH